MELWMYIAMYYGNPEFKWHCFLNVYMYVSIMYNEKNF